MIPVNDVYTLVPVAMGYADALFYCIDTDRRHLRAWLPWVDTTLSIKDTKTFIALCEKKQQEKRGIDMLILEHATNTPCGMVATHDIDPVNHATSLGYWLTSTNCGKGIMTHACNVFIPYCFRTFSLQRIAIHCAVQNTQSRAVAERIGGQFEGTLRQAQYIHNIYLDIAVYSILRHEQNS